MLCSIFIAILRGGVGPPKSLEYGYSSEKLATIPVRYTHVFIAHLFKRVPVFCLHSKVV